ncbi:MAG: glucose ABC transporter permease GlcT [Thermocladium sp.]
MRIQGLIMAIPTIFFSFLLLYLVLWNLYYSFTNWSLLNPHPSFVGLQTYISLLSTEYFSISFTHSILLSAGAVVFGNLLGLLFASLLYFLGNERLRSLYLSLLIYPLSISMAANSLIWLWLFNIHIGINWFLRMLHLPTPLWLSSPSMEFPSLMIVVIWAYAGLSLIFYLAAFMGVDKSLIEAARIDKASPFRILFRVLLPNSMNGFIVSSALLFLFSFRVFSPPYLLSGGPTNIFLQTSVVYMYYLFTTEYFAQASAVATIITAIATAVVIPYALYGIKRWMKHE